MISQSHKSGRKRIRSLDDLPGNVEEPHRKIACLRNIDICKDPEKDDFLLPCGNVPFSPEFRKNGNTEHAEEGSFPKLCQNNGIKQRLWKRFKKGHPKMLLKVHFVLLKQEMEPIQVANYLKDHDIVNQSLHARIINGPFRKDRVDTLIKGVYDLMIEENEDEVFEKFINALEESRQTYLSEKVKVLPPEPYSGKTEKEDEETLLQQFYMKSKEIILKELDAKDIIDRVVVMQGINFSDHEAILKERRKDKRIELLIKIIDSEGNKARRILRPVYDWYKQKHPEVDMTDKTEMAATSSCATRNVDVKYNFTRTVITEDANEHTDPHTQLRELQRSFVNNTSRDPDQIQEISRLFGEGCSLKYLKSSSIEFHLQTTNDESLKKLKESCKGEVAKERILRILSQRKGALQKLLELKATTVTVQLFIYDSRTESKLKHLDEVDLGCLCILNKECVETNAQEFANKIEGIEMQLITNLLKNKTLPDDLANMLEEIKAHSEKQEILQQLVDFLIQKNIPQASFCFLENEVLKVERREFINQLHENKNSSWNSDTCRSENQNIPKRSIQEHKELLEEELDAYWFYDSLKGRKDQASKEMIKTIETSSSRRSRTKDFVQYLCELDEDENEWIVDVLKQYNKHLLGILRPKALENVLDFKRGLQSVFDVVTEEIEPEDFTGLLKSSSLDQLSPRTSEPARTVVFLSNLLQTEDVDLFQEFVSAMEASNGDIVSKVRDVLDKGSLSKYYRCPRIEKEVMRRSAFCLSSQFSITEDDITGLKQDNPAIQTNDLKSNADKQITNEVNSFPPSETKAQPESSPLEKSSCHFISPSSDSSYSSISSMKRRSFCRSEETSSDNPERYMWTNITKNEMPIIPPLMSLPTSGILMKRKPNYFPINSKSINSSHLENTIGNNIKRNLFSGVPSLNPLMQTPVTMFCFNQKPTFAPCSTTSKNGDSVVNENQRPSKLGNELRHAPPYPQGKRASSAAYDTLEHRSPSQMAVYGNHPETNPYTGMSESSNWIPITDEGLPPLYRLNRHVPPYPQGKRASSADFGSTSGFMDASYDTLEYRPPNQMAVYGNYPETNPYTGMSESSNWIPITDEGVPPLYRRNRHVPPYQQGERRVRSLESVSSSGSMDDSYDTLEYRSPSQMAVYGNHLETNPYTGMSEYLKMKIKDEGVPSWYGRHRPYSRRIFGPDSTKQASQVSELIDAERMSFQKKWGIDVNEPLRRVPRHINDEIEKYPREIYNCCKSKETQSQHTPQYGYRRVFTPQHTCSLKDDGYIR